MTEAEFRHLIETTSYDNSTSILGLAAFDSATNQYDFKSLNITVDLSNQFKELTISYLEKYRRKDFRIIEFSGGYKPDFHEIESLKKEDFESITLIESIFNQDEVTFVDIEDVQFLKNLRFYFLTIKHNNETTIFFRKYGHSKELSRSKNIIARMIGDRYERLTEPTFQFDDKFDAVLTKNYLYVFNKSNFQEMFKFYDLLRETARNSLDKIKAAIPIANFSEFESSCLNHVHKLTKLRNIANKPYLDTVTIGDVRAIIDKFNLQIDIVIDSGIEKLQYDKNKQWEILNLLDDAYLSSDLTSLNYEVNSKREL